MIVAYDAKRLFCNHTGLGNYSRTIMSGLMAHFPDNHYLLLTPRSPRDPQTEPFLQSPLCTTVVPKGRWPGALWRTCLQGKDALQRGADIFHGLSGEIPIGLNRLGIPSVVTIHDVAFRTFKAMYNWQDRQIYNLKFGFAARHADRVVAISQATKRDVMKYYRIPESTISVVYQPMQPLYYSPLRVDEALERVERAGLDLPHDFMLYVGSINSRKNLLGLVKALELLPGDARLPLVIVGNGTGAYGHQVKQYIAQRNLNDLCLYRDIASNNLLQAVYTLARLLAYPSFYEGFGLPVAEALLCGCPVVTSNVSSLPEAAGPGGLLANPKDPQDIADCLLRLITDDHLHDSLAQAGREYALATFDPAQLARQMMDVYLSALRV